MKKNTQYFFNDVQIKIPSESTCVILCGVQGSGTTAFAYKHFSSHKIINFNDFVESLSCFCMLTEMNAPIIALCATDAFFHSIEKSAGKLLVAVNIPINQLDEELFEVINNHFKNLILITLDMPMQMADFDAIYQIDGTYINDVTVNIE